MRSNSQKKALKKFATGCMHVVHSAEMHHANFKICIRTVKTVLVVNSDLQLSVAPCQYLAGREIRRSLAVHPADPASTLRYDPASFTACDYFDPILQLVYVS